MYSYEVKLTTLKKAFKKSYDHLPTVCGNCGKRIQHTKMKVELTLTEYIKEEKIVEVGILSKPAYVFFTVFEKHLQLFPNGQHGRWNKKVNLKQFGGIML